MEKIAIIGGGAAGMMASIFAARRGVEVHVYEKNEKTGTKQPPQKRNHPTTHRLPPPPPPPRREKNPPGGGNETGRRYRQP